MDINSAASINPRNHHHFNYILNAYAVNAFLMMIVYSFFVFVFYSDYNYSSNNVGYNSFFKFSLRPSFW